jgi:hypothetical protein
MADQKHDMEARLKALEDKNAKLMAALEAKWEAQPTAGGIDAGQLERILTRVQESAAGPSQMLARQFKVEFDHLQRGPFEHPEGGINHPKPGLKREIIFGRPLPLTELTYAEVLALNALSDSLSRSQRRLARDGKWKATVSDDDQRLTISIPVKTIDDRQDLPSFLGIVQELTTGERALDAADMLAELTLLKAKVAEMDAARVQ